MLPVSVAQSSSGAVALRQVLPVLWMTSCLPIWRRHRKQWCRKALRGAGSTLTWGPSIPSAGPQGLKLEARSAESGGGALGAFFSFSEVAFLIFEPSDLLILTFCMFAGRDPGFRGIEAFEGDGQRSR